MTVAVGEDLLVVVSGLEDILRETEGEGGYLLVQLTEAGLLGLGHIGAGADKAFIGLGEEAELFGVEAESLALVVDGLDAGEEFLVEGDVVVVGREERGHGLGDGVHLGAVLALAEVEEDAADVLEELSAVLVGEDGVFEGRGFGVAGDGVDFGLLAGHTLLEGRHVVFGLDAGKVGDFVGCVPRGEEGIFHVVLIFASGDQHCGRGGDE